MLSLTEFSWLINILIGAMLGWSEAVNLRAGLVFTIEALLVGLLFGLSCAYGSNAISQRIASSNTVSASTKSMLTIVWPIAGIIITLFLGIFLARLFVFII